MNDLLSKIGINPEAVILLRHKPWETQLAKVLPWLASEKPHLFNTFQSSHGIPLERAMQKLENRGYIASFIGHEAKKALFIGLYTIGSSRPLTIDQFWKIKANQELRDTFGMHGFTDLGNRKIIQWFNLELMPSFYSDWKGKMVVGWPPPERSWWRRAHNNKMPILSLHEESLLDPPMPKWNEIELTWEQLKYLPTRLKSALAHWCGIYYIFDTSDRKGYVGSAYGEYNLLGRWLNYVQSGHGGNHLLKGRDPANFHFSILELVTPTMEADQIIQLENSWKNRLHTRNPHGLNDN